MTLVYVSVTPRLDKLADFGALGISVPGGPRARLAGTWDTSGTLHGQAWLVDLELLVAFLAKCS